MLNTLCGAQALSESNVVHICVDTVVADDYGSPSGSGVSYFSDIYIQCRVRYQLVALRWQRQLDPYDSKHVESYLHLDFTPEHNVAPIGR